MVKLHAFASILSGKECRPNSRSIAHKSLIVKDLDWGLSL